MNIHAQRRRRKSKDGITAPVRTLDMTAVERNLLVKRPTGGLHNGAFDLVSNSIRIDGLPAIDRSDHASDLDAAGLVLDGQIQRNSAIGAKNLVTRESEAPSLALFCGRLLRPVEAVGRSFDDISRSSIIYVTQTERHPIDARRLGKFVHETLDCENVVIPAGERIAEMRSGIVGMK